MKTITILIAPDGTSTVETKGFTGKACLEATRDIEEALGRVRERKTKREIHLPEKNVSTLRIANR